MKRGKYALYTLAALGMLAYAVPRVQVGQGWTAAGIFAAVWICFALLVVAANLHRALGVDAEARESLRRVDRMRTWQRNRSVASRLRVGKPE